MSMKAKQQQRRVNDNEVLAAKFTQWKRREYLLTVGDGTNNLHARNRRNGPNVNDR